MKIDNLKIGFIFVLYKTPPAEVERLKKEIISLKLNNFKIYFVDNTLNNQGFAGGVNIGLKKGLEEKVDVFVIANPDISLKSLKNKNFLEGLKYFDILGLGLRQESQSYYGGKIDKWRLSGGLIKKKPNKRFVEVDFISGSLMFVKRKVVETIGLFDKDYFMYYEDVDYCFRAKKKGFKVGIDSKIFYEHFESSKDNPKKDYFLFKNRCRFFLKNSNFKQKIYEIFHLPLTLIDFLTLFWRYFFKSNFLKDFFSLNFSTLINKLFHFFLFIFLIRNLSPDKYGVYSLIWAYIGFFNPFLDLGTTNYGLIYLPKKPEIFHKLISLRIFISWSIFLIANIFSFIFFKNQKNLILFVFLTSFSVLSSAWSGSYLILKAIKEKVINFSILSTGFNLIFCILIFIFYLIFRSLQAIFLAIFLSFLFYLILTFFLVKQEVGFKKFEIDINLWRKIILKSLIFVLIGFFAAIRYKFEVFLLNYFYGSASVGLYSSGYKFLEAGVLIAGSYNIISMPKFSQFSDDFNLLKRKIKKDFLFLLFISLFIILFFQLFDKWFLFLMGKKYLVGIKIAKLLVFALPFIYFNSIFYNFFYGQNKEKIVLYLLIFQAVFSFIFNFIFIKQFTYWAPTLITIFSELIIFLIAYKLYLKFIKK